MSIDYCLAILAAPLPKPPNLRDGDDETSCATCYCFSLRPGGGRDGHGECSMYGRRRVHESFVCDAHESTEEESTSQTQRTRPQSLPQRSTMLAVLTGPQTGSQLPDTVSLQDSATFFVPASSPLRS